MSEAPALGFGPLVILLYPWISYEFMLSADKLEAYKNSDIRHLGKAEVGTKSSDGWCPAPHFASQCLGNLKEIMHNRLPWPLLHL